MQSCKAPAVLLLIAACRAFAQVDPGPPNPPPMPPAAAGADEGFVAQPALPDAPPRPPTAVEQLLGPIALYPDPLIALILPASTVPADISAAAADLIQYGDATQLDGQRWDPSVRALAHYPAIISWMAENIEWTRALGSAFLASPAEVMDAIQHLRAKAMAAGALISTAQQRVVVANNIIEILPAQPDAIYAPVYDTDVVYSDEPYYGYGGPFMNFGAALPVGLWLSYGFDWGGHTVWVGGPGAWRGPGGWQQPRFGGGRVPPGAHAWRPSDRRPGDPPSGRGRHGDSVPLPEPMIGAPNPPPSHYKNPQVQADLQPAVTGSGVPLPRTPAPPLDRPRLDPGFSAPPQAARAVDTERHYVPADAGPRVQAPAPAQEGSPAPARTEAPVTSARIEPARETAPPPSRASAPAPVHEAAPAPAPAPAPASGPDNKYR